MKLQRKIRSFVKRTGRLSVSQTHALAHYRSDYCLSPTTPLSEPFFKNQTVILEIGFGMGHSFIQMAEAFPDYLCLGIEVHVPGIAQVMHEAHSRQLENIKLFEYDAVEVLKQSIPDQSIDKCQIFFPDPWHKRRHHKRRLINADFVQLLASKLRKKGILHIATDWQDYATSIQALMQTQNHYTMVKSSDEPLLQRFSTKYEKRGERLGHAIYDLLYQLK